MSFQTGYQFCVNAKNVYVFCLSVGRLSLSCTVSWNFSLQLENGPKLPGVLRLLLQKTGHWPVHDIKSFAISAFLSSLLLKEQMKISDKKNLVQDNNQVQTRS